MNRGARALCTLAAALIAAGSLSHDADARRRGNAQPRGVDRGEARSGSVHREVTRTGPGGETRMRQKDTTWTRGGGQATRDTTWTGSNGRTATRHDEVQRTETGRTSHSTYTGPNGKTGTRDASVVRDPEAGTRTKDVTWTGPEGKTAARHSEAQKTETGHTSHSTFTGPNGNVTTRDASVVNDPEAGTRTKDVTWTRPDGSTTTRSTTLSRTAADSDAPSAEAPAAE